MNSQESISKQVQQKNIAGQLHRLSRLLAQLSEHRWAADGYPEVRSGHVQLLRNLDREGTRPSVLAQRAQITKQTMGRLVKELAASGYVSLVTDPTDNRAQHVKLTDRGQRFLSYLAMTLLDLEKVFITIVGESRLADFTATLQDLLAFVEKRHQQLC